jgi:hypothetical protein
MPTISIFWGLIIRMYYKDHQPPHIHVQYQGENAVMDVLTGSMTEGDLPTRQLRVAQAWIEIHREDLLADWELCRNGENPFKIDPLK